MNISCHSCLVILNFIIVLILSLELITETSRWRNLPGNHMIAPLVSSMASKFHFSP